MSRRRTAANNDVQGPQSALTSFLREHNITATSIARRAATRNQPNQQEQSQANASAEAGPSGTRAEDDSEDDNEEQPRPSRSARSRKRKSDYDSDHLEDEDDDYKPKKKGNASKKAAEAKAKALAKKKAAAKRGRGADSDSDTDDDDDDDEYTAPSRRSKASANGPVRPPNGSFEDCARCGEQFTVSQYTLPANPGPGFLCHKCAKASGADPFKKTPARRKPRGQADKRTVTYFEERRLPSLVSLCVKVISEHIENVEALGNLGALNVDHIIRSLSRNRSLTAENAKLFYGSHVKDLAIYDATNLLPPAFCTLAMLNPNITSLRLEFCGRMDNTVLDAWSSGMPALRHLDLLGPYLIHASVWVTFIESHPQLESFLIHQSPRFDVECVKALATHCKDLSSLRLREVGKLDDDFLVYVAQMEKLTMLDLSRPSKSCSEEAMVTLINDIGNRLQALDLSGHTALSVNFLQALSASMGKQLQHLALNDLVELSDETVAKMFEAWRDRDAETARPELLTLKLANNAELGDASLNMILACTGRSLVELDIHGWLSTTTETLNLIGECAHGLRKVDVGFNRGVNDVVIKTMIDECTRIEEIKCWGCNRITVNCPRKRGVSILGIESRITA